MARPQDLPEKIRLDKWLWAARFFKTRSLAADEIDKGRVKVNGQVAKASREPRLGDEIEFKSGYSSRTVIVRGLSAVRGPAPQAALLYEETPASVLARTQAAEWRRLAPEPAHTLSQGRPTKRDRRQLSDWNQTGTPRQWNDRWSASLDE
jgi:ribosome-associated heat shock protein Hsp15